MLRNYNNEISLGYQQITGLAAVKALTLPTVPVGSTVGTAVRAVVVCTAQAIRMRDDGVDPSSTVGFPLAVGQIYELTGDLAKYKFIEQAASAVLEVLYYGIRP